MNTGPHLLFKHNNYKQEYKILQWRIQRGAQRGNQEQNTMFYKDAQVLKVQSTYLIQ